MKIYDIINEDQNVDEALGTLAKIGSKVLGPAAKAGATLLGKGPTARVIDSLAVNIAHGGKPTVGMTAKMLKSAGSSDDAAKVLAKARKEAAALKRSSDLASNVAGIKAAAASAKESISAGTKFLFGLGRLGLGAYYLSMFKEPLDLYLNNIEAAETRLNATNPEDRWTPEQFEAYRQREMSALIGKWALLWGTGKLVKLPFGMFTKMVGYVSPKLGAAVSTLGVGAQAYFMKWVNEPENANDIASFMAQPLMTFAAGGIGTAAEDKIRSVLPFAKKYEKAPADSAAPAQNKQQPDNKPEAEPNGKETGQAAKPSAATAPEASAKKDPAVWVYHSPGFVQNKHTGEIDYAD